MELVTRSCPSCGSMDFNKVFDQPTESIIGLGNIGYHHQIQICKPCGFVFAAPLLPDEAILKYYETMSNYEHPHLNGGRPDVEKRQIHRYLDLIQGRFPANFKGKALDIGCATAYGLAQLQNKGWNVVGMDPSQKCVEISKEMYNVKVINAFFDYDKIKDEGPFDVVILCHVFEHLIHPKEVASKIAKILKDDGLLYIEVPNLLKPFAPKCYFVFEHVNFFTPQSLTNLMAEAGYESDLLETFDNGPEISPYYPVIAATWKKTSKKIPMVNDYQRSFEVVAKFEKDSKELIKSIQTKIDKILGEVKEGKLALWGAGIHTSQLLSETSLKSAKLACIYDSDPKKTGNKLLGHEIRYLANDIETLKQRVDAILISSEASEGIIYEQIKHLEQKGIKIYKLYS